MVEVYNFLPNGIPRCCLKSKVGRQHTRAGYVGCCICLSGPVAFAIFCSLAPVLMLWRSQTGTLDSGLSAKVEFKPHASFSLVANLSERLLGLPPAKSHPGGTLPQGHRKWPAKGYGSTGCQSCWGHGWITGTRGTHGNNSSPGFFDNQLSTLSGNAVSGIIWNCLAGSSWGLVKSPGQRVPS